MSDPGGPGVAPAPRALMRWVWLATFVYAALVAALVQLVVLPYLLPAWHQGMGLLVGGDWIAFHNLAAVRAELIRSHGWGAFELRPYGNAPVGIASAIYALTRPAPWTLIPLNAALHATGAALLCHLLRGFVTDWRWAVIGTAPFVLYPSALVWVAQIHKDGAFIVGYLSLFDAWASLAPGPRAPTGGGPLLRALGLVLLGFGLIWVVRPDLLIVTQAATALAFAVLLVGTRGRARSGPSGRRPATVVLALLGLVTLAAVWATSSPTRFLRERTPAPTAPDTPRVTRGPVPWAGEPLPSTGDPARGVGAIPWYRAAWLPASVDRVAYRIALTREVYLIYYRDGLSNMDAGVGFYRAADLVRYLPRALQIALLAPFPRTWADPGSSAWTTVSRRLVAGEMLGVYLGLLGLVPSLWRWRRRPALWVVILPCLAVLALYSLTIPNLGALHRFRYGFLMTLVGLGIAGGLDLLAARRRRAPAGDAA